MTFPTLGEGSIWTSRYHTQFVKSMFENNPPHVFTTAGDLPIATSAGVISRRGIGTNGQMLESRASDPTGRRWVNSGLVPIGGIVIWSGSIVTIPTDWQICDGTNGTPDLRGKFIVGSGSSYAIGATGGAASINLQHSHAINGTTGSAGAHTHTQAATNSSGAHAHTFSGSTAVTGTPAAQVNAYPDTNVSADTHTHTMSGSTSSDGAHTHTNPTTGSSGDHTHTVSPTTSNNQLSASLDIRPPYYALAFIMRMA